MELNVQNWRQFVLPLVFFTQVFTHDPPRPGVITGPVPGSAGARSNKGIAMSWDEPRLRAVTGAAPFPGPGEPVSPSQHGEELTLRRQAMEVINDVLADSDPESEWARTQLRELLASHPDEPERALLEHLIATRTMTEPPRDVPVRFLPDRFPPVLFAGGQRRRIRAVLGNRIR